MPSPFWSWGNALFFCWPWGSVLASRIKLAGNRQSKRQDEILEIKRFGRKSISSAGQVHGIMQSAVRVMQWCMWKFAFDHALKELWQLEVFLFGAVKLHVCYNLEQTSVPTAFMSCSSLRICANLWQQFVTTNCGNNLCVSKAHHSQVIVVQERIWMSHFHLYLSDCRFHVLLIHWDTDGNATFKSFPEQQSPGNGGLSTHKLLSQICTCQKLLSKIVVKY